MNAIPSVNLEDFLSSDLKRKQKFTEEIGNAYENIGFVALKGHFLDDKLLILVRYGHHHYLIFLFSIRPLRDLYHRR